MKGCNDTQPAGGCATHSLTARDISVIVPVYAEGSGLPGRLRELLAAAPWREVLVADAGPARVDVGRFVGDSRLHWLMVARRARAAQMNAAAARAGGAVLLFVHADTRFPTGAAAAICDALDCGHLWGRFDVRLDAPGAAYRVIEWMMNWRSALTGIATGDQTIFVRRETFERLGGYADLALMEDIELSYRLKRSGRPARLRSPVVTSARRWQVGGVVRTILRMWLLRLAYWAGVPAARLARWYQPIR